MAKGKGSIGHNSRTFKADNIDEERTKFNVCYVNEDIKVAYDNLFSNALEDYNSKQKRSDRRIENYYEKIRTSKQEKLFYEVVVQVGNCSDMATTSENGELSKNILGKYMNDFVERNPNLYVFSAHLHMD